MPRDVLIVDNFDSFTYNLVEDFSTLDCEVAVQRNDVPMSRLKSLLKTMRDPLIVLSPGPGTPEDAGCCIELIREAEGRYPLLGICLGHQALVVAFGGAVGRAPEPVHGQCSIISYEDHPIFRGLPNPFAAARYHSLAATRMPDELRVIATTSGIVMGAAHRTRAMVGLQFHPESLLTTHGRALIVNVARDLRECAPE